MKVCQRHREFAQQLYTALLRKELTWPRPSEQIAAWAESFAELEYEDQYSAKHIERVLTWYCKAAGGEWVPQAFSGGSFRLKFDRIEAASKRMPVIEKIAADITRIDTKAKEEKRIDREWRRFWKRHDAYLVVVPKGFEVDYSQMPLTPRLQVAVDKYLATCNRKRTIR